MSIQIPISFGEFLDKLTILQIKQQRISDQDKLANVTSELQALQVLWQKQSASNTGEVNELVNELKEINEQLWEIEDAIREKEKSKQFDEEFIRLARKVYVTNDKRADIKKQINVKLGSEFIEEKSYSDYS